MGENVGKSLDGKILQQMNKVIEDLCLYKNFDPVVVCPFPQAIYILDDHCFKIKTFSPKSLVHSKPKGGVR